MRQNLDEAISRTKTLFSQLATLNPDHELLEFLKKPDVPNNTLWKEFEARFGGQSKSGTDTDSIEHQADCFERYANALAAAIGEEKMRKAA